MAVGKMQNCGMWTVEGKMQNGNCGMVGKMHNAEICTCGQSNVHERAWFIPVNGHVLYVSC